MVITAPDGVGPRRDGTADRGAGTRREVVARNLRVEVVLQVIGQFQEERRREPTAQGVCLGQRRLSVVAVGQVDRQQRIDPAPHNRQSHVTQDGGGPRPENDPGDRDEGGPGRLGDQPATLVKDKSSRPFRMSPENSLNWQGFTKTGNSPIDGGSPRAIRPGSLLPSAASAALREAPLPRSRRSP